MILRRAHHRTFQRVFGRKPHDLRHPHPCLSSLSNQFNSNIDILTFLASAPIIVIPALKYSPNCLILNASLATSIITQATSRTRSSLFSSTSTYRAVRQGDDKQQRCVGQGKPQAVTLTISNPLCKSYEFILADRPNKACHGHPSLRPFISGLSSNKWITSILSLVDTARQYLR